MAGSPETVSDIAASAGEAWTHLVKGRLNEAILMARRIVAADPNNPEANYIIAEEALSRKVVEDAIRHLEIAINARPGFADALGQLGLVYMRQGDFSKAETYLERAVAARPDSSVEDRLNLSVIYMNSGRPALAIPHVEQALALSPGIAAAHYVLANCHRDLGHTQDALIHYRRAVEIDPELGEAHSRLGKILLADRKYRAAVPHLRQAMKLLPDDDSIERVLGSALLSVGEYNEGLCHTGRVSGYIEMTPVGDAPYRIVT